MTREKKHSLNPNPPVTNGGYGDFKILNNGLKKFTD